MATVISLGLRGVSPAMNYQGSMQSRLIDRIHLQFIYQDACKASSHYTQFCSLNATQVPFRTTEDTN